MARKPAKKKAPKKTKLVPHEQNLPASMSLEDDAGDGMENIDQDSMAIPYIALLQTNSPQADKKDERYLDGAEPGMFFHTVTEKLYDSITVVPAEFERVFNEWGDRKKGGGFKGRFSVAEFKAEKSERNDTGKYWRPDGNTYFMDTRNHYVILIDEETGDPEPVIISLSSTQLKVSRKLMSVLRGIKFPKKNGKGSFNPPSYAHKFQVTSTREENAKGKYSGWHFSILGQLDKTEAAIYAAGKKFAELVKEDGARAADPAVDTDEEDEEASM